MSNNQEPSSNAHSAPSPAASTRRSAPSVRWAARRASSNAPGRVLLGRGRQALYRLHRLLGPDDPRPRPSRSARSGAARAGAMASRSARRPNRKSKSPKKSASWCPSIEQVPHGLERHRSDHERDASRARLHRTAAASSSSKAAITATRTACWSRPARALLTFGEPDFGGRAGGYRRAHHGARLQRRRAARRSVQGVRQRDRLA